jgi:hypothetical protein
MRKCLVVPLSLLASYAFSLVLGEPVQARSNDVYTLEFRSRANQDFGHNFVILRHTRGNRLVHKHMAGFDAVSHDSFLAKVVGAPGRVFIERRDLTAPVLKRYRVRVSGSDYRRALRTVNALRRNPPVFSYVYSNCNTFIGDVARSANLETPLWDMQFADDYVNGLKIMNAGRHRPLRVAYKHRRAYKVRRTV